jgi:hypothetical protein
MIRHPATVEEVFDDEGYRAFRAVCLETGAVCDAWAFPEDWGLAIAAEYPPDERDGAAIERALEYLGDRRLHGFDSPHFCDAEHFIEGQEP